jgi:hypothetical protein
LGFLPHLHASEYRSFSPETPSSLHNSCMCSCRFNSAYQVSTSSLRVIKS